MRCDPKFFSHILSVALMAALAASGAWLLVGGSGEFFLSVA